MGNLIILGSGEFTPIMLPVDRQLFSGFLKPIVAIIPTAAGQESGYWKWVDNGISHFKKLRIPAFGLDIRVRDDAFNRDLISQLDRANIIYFSGGDPGYLASVVLSTPLWQKIITKYHHGCYLVGSSAGAMLLGKYLLANIYDVVDHDHQSLDWIPAAGIVDKTVWPHYNYIKQNMEGRWQEIISQSPPDIRNNWLGIDENTAAVWQGDSTFRVLGNGKVHLS